MNDDVAIVKFVDKCIDMTVCGRWEDPESFVFECRGLLEILGCTKIALDFSDVKFFSSAALGATMALHMRAIAAGGKLVLFQVVNEHLIEKFKITRLNERFFFAATLDDAIACM
jgi:anti-anti-sigma factor